MRATIRGYLRILLCLIVIMFNPYTKKYIDAVFKDKIYITRLYYTRVLRTLSYIFIMHDCAKEYKSNISRDIYKQR